MPTTEDLRRRYISLNGSRPASATLLAEIEIKLGVKLPRQFLDICEFFDGSGLNTRPLFSLSGNALNFNPLSETALLRSAIGLPQIYLFLAEPPESMIIMECLVQVRFYGWMQATQDA